MDLGKAVRVPIERRVEIREGPVINDDLFKAYLSIFGEYANEKRRPPAMNFFATDEYGRSLYQCNKSRKTPDGYVFRSVMVLFQADGSFDYLELADSIRYDQIELREFKKRNNWNQPSIRFP